MSLRKEIEDALNRASAENASNTPDYVLAGFLMMSLEAFDAAAMARDAFYGIRPSPGTAVGVATHDEIQRVIDGIQGAMRDAAEGEDAP